MSATEYDIIIAGGGLAGQTAALLLSGFSNRIAVFEKKIFPEHKVCGEYLSNDILPVINECGFDPYGSGASRISKIKLCSASGKSSVYRDNEGGFGISRFHLDQQLSILTREKAEFHEGIKIISSRYETGNFIVSTSDGKELKTKYFIAAYGKRDNLDKLLKRPFFKTHSGYLGVKYHIKGSFPADEIALYFFKGGYCGLVKIENDLYNLCYLVNIAGNVHAKGTDAIEQQILFQNPQLKEIFLNAAIIKESKSSIHQVYFGNKEIVKDHILFCGDAAGMITPLCGNGMSMAIQGAKLLADAFKNEIKAAGSLSAADRSRIEINYTRSWNSAFSSRLKWGRFLQGLSENTVLSGSALSVLRAIPPLAEFVISRTHAPLKN